MYHKLLTRSIFIIQKQVNQLLSKQTECLKMNGNYKAAVIIKLWSNYLHNKCWTIETV